MSADRIVVDTRLVLDKPTGIGQYIASLLREMIAAAPERQFWLVRRADPWSDYGIAEWNEPNVEHVVTPLRHMSLRQQWEVPALLRHLRPDVFLYPHFDAPLHFHHVPTVAAVHDAKYLVAPELFPRFGRAKLTYMRHMFAATLRGARRTLVPSEATAADLERLFGPIARTPRVIPYATEARFRPADDAAVERFRRNHSLSRGFVLCVGEFRPHKNHAALLQAWARTAAKGTHDLVLVGRRHPEGVDPEALARAAGVEVRVLSDLDDAGLVAAYTGADVFALISLYEGFGFPVLEAMACGAPVLASNTTSLAEVVGEAGFTVDPRDSGGVARALDRLISDQDLRARLAEEGSKRCEQFRWRRTAVETLAVCDEVVGSA